MHRQRMSSYHSPKVVKMDEAQPEVACSPLVLVPNEFPIATLGIGAP
jgi:hypothetical protein